MKKRFRCTEWCDIDFEADVPPSASTAPCPRCDNAAPALKAADVSANAPVLTFASPSPTESFLQLLAQAKQVGGCVHLYIEGHAALFGGKVDHLDSYVVRLQGATRQTIRIDQISAIEEIETP